MTQDNDYNEFAEDPILGDAHPDVIQVYGSAENIEKLGSPSGRAEDPNAPNVVYYFYPTWRCQLFHLIGFLILCYLSVLCSHWAPLTVIRGPLFSLGNTTYFLDLPVLSLIPAAMLGKILLYMYNSKYIIDDNGVEAQVGLVSLNLRQPRLRYEDIRGVEPNQTIWERILGIGTVLIGSAMTDDVEITMSGVANPRAIQLLINSERDRRVRALTAGDSERGRKILAMTGD